MENNDIKSQAGINYYVLTLFFILIVGYVIVNHVDPIIEPRVDGLELLVMLGFPAAAIFAFWVAKKYWGSTVFGNAYLALGIAYALYAAGDSLWLYYEVILQEAPYPSLADVGYFGFYPFAIYHLRTNIHYFKRSLDKSQKMILLAIPIGSCIIYLFFTLLLVDASAGIFNTVVSPQEIDPSLLILGLAYVAATTTVFSFAIVGLQVFKSGKLSSAWGLLFIGLALNTVADYYYYYAENFGEYLRSNPVNGLWLASTMIICYALYKHVKSI
jgi:hypothetical protein